MPRTKNELATELVRIQKEYERLQKEFLKIANDAQKATVKGITARDAAALAKLRKRMRLE
jgi:hypothetical protein